MIIHRLVAALFLPALLTGCAHNPDPPSMIKVKAALTQLHANPDTVYLEPLVADSPATGQLSRQTLLVVPDPDHKTFKIIDSQGDIFDNYTEFLRNNALPDQQGR